MKYNKLLQYLLSVSLPIDFSKYPLLMTCTSYELNLHAPPHAQLCYDFLNYGYCQYERTAGVCNYRHLPADHIDAVVDAIFAGKVGGAGRVRDRCLFL